MDNNNPIQGRRDCIERRYQTRIRACRHLTEVQDTLLCHAAVLVRSMLVPDKDADPERHAEHLRALETYQATEKRAQDARAAMKKAMRS